jgi:hypothetical protein
MSMSTSVVGIKPPDDMWKKMKAVYEACEDANVPIPVEVAEFFEHDKPDELGVVVEIKGEAIKEWSDDTEAGYEVDIEKLPKDVKVLRFYNSW